MMDQTKFIYMIKKVNPISVTDDGNGLVVVLRKDIHITHDYRKNNKMEITFNDDKKTFLIPSQNELESLLRIHLGSINFNEPAMKYCKQHLQEL